MNGSTDSVIIALVPRLQGFDTDVLEAIAEEAGRSGLTVLGNLVGYQVLQNGQTALGPVPLYATPEDAVRALGSVTDYSVWRARDWGKPVDPFGCKADDARDFVEQLLADNPDGLELTPEDTRTLLGFYGIWVIPHQQVVGVEEVVEAAARLGYPVALKYANQVLRERRDVIGARLDIDDEEELIADVEDMLELDDPAVAEGFIVQPMITSGVPVEIATMEDPLFGPILSFGFVGDAIDLLGDIAYRIPPLTTGDVHDLVREVKASPRLFGYGGSANLDVDALEDLLARAGRMAEDLPEMASLELTPVLVTATSASPLWARVALAPPPSRVDTGLVRRL